MNYEFLLSFAMITLVAICLAVLGFGVMNRWIKLKTRKFDPVAIGVRGGRVILVTAICMEMLALCILTDCPSYTYAMFFAIPIVCLVGETAMLTVRNKIA